MGTPWSVYLSNVNFEATYSYVEKVGFQICFFAGLFDQLDGFAR